MTRRSRRWSRHRPNDGSVGGPSAEPVIAAKPLIASANVPKPVALRVWPGLTEARETHDDEARIGFV
jgi:hypothetical protein